MNDKVYAALVDLCVDICRRNGKKRLLWISDQVKALSYEVKSDEKYAFRCFLLRLGFIGDEFKKSRKILLANLDGSSAFKTVKENLPTAPTESEETNEEAHDEVSE